MIEEYFEDYKIVAIAQKTYNGKWAVSTKIQKTIDNTTKEKIFYAHDKILYILEIEAAKECINLGKNLIMRNMVGF